jgi:hypothetical protein
MCSLQYALQCATHFSNCARYSRQHHQICLPHVVHEMPNDDPDICSAVLTFIWENDTCHLLYSLPAIWTCEWVSLSGANSLSSWSQTRNQQATCSSDFEQITWRYNPEIIRGFPHSLHVNSVLILQFRPQPLPCISFPIWHCICLGVDAIVK